MVRRVLVSGAWALLLLVSAPLTARSLTLDAIKTMPESIEKDYRIWRYLTSGHCTKRDAETLIRQARRINTKLAKAYRHITGHRPPKRTHHRPHPLTPAQRAKNARNKALVRSLLASKHPLADWQRLDPAQQLYLFNRLGRHGRKRLDHALDRNTFARLSTVRGFDTAIQHILRERPPKLLASLHLLPDAHHRMRYETLMQVGFFNLLQERPRIAERYFDLAIRATNRRDQRDRALFWAYKSHRNRRYLDRLLSSYDLSIYTLAARDIAHQKYPKTITPKLPKTQRLDRAIYDPIFWAKLKRKIFDKKTDLKALATHYRSAEAVGYYTYILSKASRETQHYFPMPYRDLLERLPKSRQAILYAIARQESHFVPASVSASFALGMMQIMPFLVDHLAKQQHEKIDYDAMFDPRTALRYANEHMNYLTRWLQHPLFIAYAYNAGIGYTRRLIRRRHLFAGHGAYEPFLSLERVDNAQARLYGKHVLTNYVIYMNKLGVPLRLSDLLATLHRPEKTDKFRKRKHHE